jgi:hypothetical protein
MGNLVTWLLLRPWLEPIGRLALRCAAAALLLIAAQVVVVRLLGPGAVPGCMTVALLLVVGRALLRAAARGRGTGGGPLGVSVAGGIQICRGTGGLLVRATLCWQRTARPVGNGTPGAGPPRGSGTARSALDKEGDQLST